MHDRSRRRGCGRWASWPPARSTRAWRSTAPTTVFTCWSRAWGDGTVSAVLPDNRPAISGKGPCRRRPTPPARTAPPQQFKNAKDLASLTAIMDVPSSLTTWGAEALINDADGYYGGFHNFYSTIRARRDSCSFRKTPTRSSTGWTPSTAAGAADHPIFWWSSRGQPAPTPGDKWLIVLGDAAQRVHYADAIAALLAKWNVAQIQGWIDSWSQQISAAAASDPHAWATPADTQMATQTARDIVAKRPAYLQTFVDCEHGVAGAATDGDGDGYKWCDECDDANPNTHPGAKEIAATASTTTATASSTTGASKRTIPTTRRPKAPSDRRRYRRPTGRSPAGTDPRGRWRWPPSAGPAARDLLDRLQERAVAVGDRSGVSALDVGADRHERHLRASPFRLVPHDEQNAVVRVHEVDDRRQIRRQPGVARGDHVAGRATGVAVHVVADVGDDEVVLTDRPEANA